MVYPMLFQLTNSKTHRTTHAGVLEFVADEGKCYLPYWVRLPGLMIRTLGRSEEMIIKICYADVAKSLV